MYLKMIKGDKIKPGDRDVFHVDVKGIMRQDNGRFVVIVEIPFTSLTIATQVAANLIEEE